MGKVEELYVKACEDLDDVTKELEPLRKKADTIRAEMAPLDAKLREVNKEIKAIKFPKMADAKMLVARLAPKGIKLGASEAPTE